MLKILVPVKRAVDYNVRVRAKADGSGLDIANAKMAMNPFDEIAVEEAVRLKEAGAAGDVEVVPDELTPQVPLIQKPFTKEQLGHVLQAPLH